MAPHCVAVRCFVTLIEQRPDEAPVNTALTVLAISAGMLQTLAHRSSNKISLDEFRLDRIWLDQFSPKQFNATQ
jgi:hypothetical protein